MWFVYVLYSRPTPANRIGKSKTKRLSDIQKDLGREQAKFLQSFPPSQMAPLLQLWKFIRVGDLSDFFPRKSERLFIEGPLILNLSGKRSL